MRRVRISPAIFVALFLYLVGGAGIVLALSQWRTAALAELNTPEELARWQKWKSEAARQEGPVVRRPPTSDEPPTLVLLRDYFAVLLVASLVFYSFLFALAVFLGCGILRGGSRAYITPPRASEH